MTEPAVCDANQNVKEEQTWFKLQSIWSICFIKYLVSSHSNLQPNWCFLIQIKYIDIVFNQQCGVEYSLTWNRRKCTNICLRLVIGWQFYFKRVFFRFSYWKYCQASFQGGRSFAGARGAPAEKFGLGRKFQARTYAILSRIKICRDLRTFFGDLWA